MTAGITANQFRQALGSALAPMLSRPFKFFRSNLELRNVNLAIQNCIYISGSSQNSPYVDISFIFGCRYKEISKIAKEAGLPDSLLHISQNSHNRHTMKGLPFSGPGKSSWSFDIRKSTQQDTLNEMVNSFEHMIFPFFDRFNNITAARDAIGSDDSWCLGGKQNVLLFDVALGDLDHFEHWCKKLGSDYKGQASELRKQLF